MGFSRQEHWSGLPFPSPWHLPNTGIKPRSPALQADSLLSDPPGKPGGAPSRFDPGGAVLHLCGQEGLLDFESEK